MMASKKQVAAKTATAKKSAVKKPAAKTPAAKTPAAKTPLVSALPPRKPGEIRYWLLKQEPEKFSFDDLRAAPAQTTCWDGVRNYQARNYLRDQMAEGDLAFYYHSNAEPPGIAGVCRIVRAGYPDHTAFDRRHDYFDPDSDPDAPTWYMVDVQAVEPVEPVLSLDALRALSGLDGMLLLQRGSRLSVQPVSAAHWARITTAISAR
jgi:predicted RNA-binding protein with PUA-like domain